jgi:2-dehydro-3-deoxygluconokinase
MKQIITFGELMLRLSAPGHEYLLQNAVLSATFGGAEANVAVSLANFGNAVAFVSALPDNEVGDAAIMELRKFGVDASMIVRSPRRMGIYYTQTGSNMRPSKVIYDREGSAIACARREDFDWNQILADADWFHVTGITPAVSEALHDITLDALTTCAARGITVSCDLNYRAKLWKWGKPPREVMPAIVEHVDVLIANEEDCQQCLGITVDVDVDKGAVAATSYAGMIRDLFARFPRLKHVAVSLRESNSADDNTWSGLLAGRDMTCLSPRYRIADIVDRIGGGDAFAAGLIHCLKQNDQPQTAIDFAVAASALKHTIHGDFSRTRMADVQTVVRGNLSGRVQR